MKRLKAKILATVLAISTLVASVPMCVFAEESTETTATTIPSNNFEIAKEMNLGFNIGRTFEDVATNRQNLYCIKKRINSAYKQGFNTIRIPVEFMVYADENGNIIEDAKFKMVKDTVDYAYDKGLYVILDSMNDIGNTWDLPDVNTEKFVTQYTNMWTDIARIFNEDEYDYHLIFEPYNEPINVKGDVSGYGYDYKANYSGRCDSYYFAGRCGNLKNMMTLNGIFADIMKKVAPNRYYMISSYNMDPMSAYTNYKNMTWENSDDHNVNGVGTDAYLKFDNVDQTKAIYDCHVYKYGTAFCNEIAKLSRTFKERGVNLPIYITENGTQYRNFVNLSSEDGTAKYYTRPAEYMHSIGSGLCLWDDTLDMSYMDPWKYTWRNQALMDRLSKNTGSAKRTADKQCNVEIKVNGVDYTNVTAIEDTPYKTLVLNLLENSEYSEYSDYIIYNSDNITIDRSEIGKDAIVFECDPVRYIVKDVTLNIKVAGFDIPTESETDTEEESSEIETTTEESSEVENTEIESSVEESSEIEETTEETSEIETTIEETTEETSETEESSTAPIEKKYYAVQVNKAEEGECDRNDALITLWLPEGTSCTDVIDKVYAKLGDNLPTKEGYDLVGFYQEGTRKYFLYQDSGRPLGSRIILYPKFEKSKEVVTDPTPVETCTVVICKDEEYEIEF